MNRLKITAIVLGVFIGLATLGFMGFPQSAQFKIGV